MDRGFGHTLAVDGIQRADGISDDAKVRGKPAHPIVAVPAIGWDPQLSKIGHAPRPAEEIVRLVRCQRSGELQESSVIKRGVILEQSPQRDLPSLALDWL